MIGTVVSAVCYRDAKVWAVAARQVMACIPARRYLAIVPDDEIEKFRVLAPAGYEVAGDNTWLGGLTKKAIADMLPVSIKRRAGWYVQQFVKIASIVEGADDDVNLIWDGDTVPLRPLEFVTADGRLQYYMASENHTPYFDVIEVLLGLRKATDFSFVSQCFPVRAGWVREMIALIEKRSGKDWRRAILAALPGKHVSEFSEYETLGQFAVQLHRDEVAFTTRQWHRFGHNFVSHPRRFKARTMRFISMKYDFLAFEHWDERANMRERRERGTRYLVIALGGILISMPVIGRWLHRSLTAVQTRRSNRRATMGSAALR